MTDALTYDSISYEPLYAATTSDRTFVPRPKWLPLVFVPGLIFCGLSWALGGIAPLTDCGFLYLTAVCVILLVNEIRMFPRRFGIGAMVLFGGTLVWFCHDYATNWLGQPFDDGVRVVQLDASTIDMHVSTVARSATFHVLFVALMTFGLSITRGKWLERLFLKVPEPSTPSLYLWTMLAMNAVGLACFAVFTSENFFISAYKGALGAWVGNVNWISGRSGNFNYSWGAYIAQILEIGVLGGMFGAFYAIYFARNILGKVMGWSFWFYWLLYQMQGGRRGQVASMVLPVIGFLYLKYLTKASARSGAPRQSIVALVVCAVIGFALLALVQFVGMYRNVNYDLASVHSIELTTNRGNDMFSEGLVGFELIPNKYEYFGNTFPLEGAFRTVPETAFWFVVGALPRAVWTTKPEDRAMTWYNAVVTNRENGREGTTISQGLVGHFYFRYGAAGVVEGGFLVGWLMGVSERVFRQSKERPVGILLSLVFATWLFRIFRNFYFSELYGPIIGALAFTAIVLMTRPFFKRT